MEDRRNAFAQAGKDVRVEERPGSARGRNGLMWRGARRARRDDRAYWEFTGSIFREE
jgi:hypothetical protein